MHASPPLGKRTWTAEEENYLRESWGTVTVDGICRHLNRTKNAIMVRVNRLGLPPYLESGEYITLHQLSRALGFGATSDKYFLKSWVENRGFPLHYKRRGTATIRVVYLDEFWHGPRKTVLSWTSPRWSLWRWARSRTGCRSSAEKTTRPMRSRGKTCGHLQRTPASKCY